MGVSIKIAEDVGVGVLVGIVGVTVGVKVGGTVADTDVSVVVGVEVKVEVEVGGSVGGIGTLVEVGEGLSVGVSVSIVDTTVGVKLAGVSVGVERRKANGVSLLHPTKYKTMPTIKTKTIQMTFAHKLVSTSVQCVIGQSNIFCTCLPSDSEGVFSSKTILSGSATSRFSGSAISRIVVLSDFT